MKNIFEKSKELLEKVKNFKKNKEDAADFTDEKEAGSVSSDTFVKTELSEEDKKATQAAQDEIKNKLLQKKGLIKKIIIGLVIFIIITVICIIVSKNKEKNENIQEAMKQAAEVVRMNISSEISGSGTLKPKDNYTITALVEGNVTNVLFNTGEKVVKDQLLITIESSTAYRNIVTASSSVLQAQDAYKQAKYEYDKVEDDYSGRTYKAPFTGSLRTFSVKAGDKLKNGTEIGSIINDKVMNIKVPFVSGDATKIKVGMTAILELQETGEYLTGTVKSIAQESQSINSGALVRYVTIRCDNPGGLTTNNTAIAYIDAFVSVEDAAFEYETNEKITFNDGNDVEIEKLLVSEGANVVKGTPLFLISENTINNIITQKKRSYLSAKEALTREENNYKDAIDKYDEYFITSPIDGTVISKDIKAGDKIQRSTSNAKTLCTIYDLSELSFDMDVDEMDIVKAKVGQEVNIQADAFGNKTFKGVITNVSLVAANSNGVTNYPVTVTLNDVGELIPGMNVDAYIILSSVENALAIPTGALQRGNVVYVLNTSPTIKSKNYSEEGITERVKQRVPEGFTAINVESGISNENFIEIKSGLQEGDQVYVTESANTNSFQFGGPRGGMGGGPRR